MNIPFYSISTIKQAVFYRTIWPRLKNDLKDTTVIGLSNKWHS